MQALVALSARLAHAVLLAACACLALLGIVVLYGVVMRYAFSDAPPYVEQVALLLVISVAMFGAAAGVHSAGHIGLDSLTRLLPPRAQFWTGVVVDLLTLTFAAVLLWGSIRMGISTHHDTIPTLGISEAFRYLPPVIASVLIIVFSIERLLAAFRPELRAA
ncbi:MAG: TRAP transporter small permease [Proteobacteria bacterium]|nr:TRAP transporter small permease [Pseudomonadota bacterium]